MDPLDLAQFERQSTEFDALVAATPDIDRFCSSSDWILPAARALMPERRPWIFKDARCQIALMRSRHPRGWVYLEPLEAMWGLACPVVGADSGEAVARLCQLMNRRDSEWNVAVLSGVPLGSQLSRDLGAAMTARWEVIEGPVSTRCVASLAGGVDGFLARRSRNFRRALRRSLRAADEAGIEFLARDARHADDARILYQMAMAVESRSWKGRAGVGVHAGAMYEFYRAMVPRLARRGCLRLMFAVDRRPACSPHIAYVLGGVFGTTYRGLQFSFDPEYDRLALGNLCQYRQIVELCSQGITDYDLGTDMLYKRRWAEMTRDSVALIAVKR